MTSILKKCTLLAVATTGLVSMSGITLAESDPMARNQYKIDTGVRFPGDVALKEGTVRTSGPEKGAYIERCTWGFNSTVSKGFGLTQKCVRYTLKNTH